MNLVENEFTQMQQSKKKSPITSAISKEASGGKTDADKEAAADATYAAFAWLFGSGCF